MSIKSPTLLKPSATLSRTCPYFLLVGVGKGATFLTAETWKPLFMRECWQTGGLGGDAVDVVQNTFETFS